MYVCMYVCMHVCIMHACNESFDEKCDYVITTAFHDHRAEIGTWWYFHILPRKSGSSQEKLPQSSGEFFR